MQAIFRGEANIDFVGRIPLFAMFSSIVVGLSIVATILMGINFGIDFAGGYEIQTKFPQDVKVTDSRIKALIEPLGLGDARVQTFGDPEDNEFLILVREHGTIADATKGVLQSGFEAVHGADCLNDLSIAESGERMTVAFCKPTPEEKVREIIASQGLQIKDLEKGEREDQPNFEVAIVSIADQIESTLRSGLDIPKAADGSEVELIPRREFVGPQVGAQLRNQGILAVVWALFFILLYVGVRFDLFFAPGAVIALVHDVAITVGLFAVLQLEFNLPIIAAILAIIGYSLNDTIVVYDRIRENTVRLRGRGLRAMVNTSINQTLSRTLLTSGTTLLVVLALLIFGGGIIRDFSIALLIGVLVGTYSSVAVATPAYVLLRERYSTKGDGSTAKAAAA